MDQAMELWGYRRDVGCSNLSFRWATDQPVDGRLYADGNGLPSCGVPRRRLGYR